MRNLALSLGCLILSSTCLAQTWLQVKPTTSPSARNYHVMSYDSISQRTVLFGGWIQLNDTWEYDGTNWTLLKTTVAPPGRDLSEMVYDQGRLQSLLFGGQIGPNFLNDTWVFSSIKKIWTQLKPKNSPPGRFNAALAYDSARRRVVLFGGWGSAGVLNDTWEWDGTNWTQIKTTNAPSARTTTIEYDSARKRVVLVGGWPATYDTWEYDGKNWTQIKTTNSPSTNCCKGLAYDSARQRMVMFGGFNTSYQSNNDTWEYDGKNWTQIKPIASPPVRRDQDFMVYDSRRGRVVIFGGGTTSRPLSDTWEYAGPQTLTGSPSTISIATGGTHTFTLNAGTPNASRLYWIFGSMTGTSPGVTLLSAVGSVTIPLVPDLYTNLTISSANTGPWVSTRGTLDAAGKNTLASIVVPKITDPNVIGLMFYHAYLVYDASNNFHMASNPVRLTLVK